MRTVISLVRAIWPDRSCTHDDALPVGTIELRIARPNDAAAVRRLAELDSSPALTGQVVIALINGDAVAGLSLLDQRVVANPFVATPGPVALLRLRAEQLSGAPTHRTLRRLLRLRSA